MAEFNIENYRILEDTGILPPNVRAYRVRKGDVLFFDDIAMKKLCPEPIHMLKRFPLDGDGYLHGMVTKCVWSEKKWWQFWKKKKWLGCHVEVL